MSFLIKNNPYDPSYCARAVVTAGLCGTVEVCTYSRDTRHDWPMWSTAGEVVTLGEIYDRERQWNDAAAIAHLESSRSIAAWCLRMTKTF